MTAHILYSWCACKQVDKEQPKKQRRKPVIASVTDQAVDDVDSHAVDATQAPSDPMQEEEEAEAKSEADEPLSDMEADAEPDADAEAEAEAAAEAEAEAEADSEDEQEAEGAKKRTTARKKGMGSYRGSGPRRLKADMPGVVNVVRDMAYEPGSFEWDGRAAEGAAFLSFRELVRLWLTVCLSCNVHHYALKSQELHESSHEWI